MRAPLLAALAMAAPLQSTGQGGSLAAGLAPGMQLLYQSEGEAQPPWSVDSVRRGESLRERSECAVVHLRRRPDAATAEESRLCLAHDTLYVWEAKRRRWSIQRPVGPGMTWTTRRDNGDEVRYETDQTARETISGQPIAVVHTTVTTSDSSGRPKRRLRERYALALTTATGGAFETADSTGAWRIQRRFELREIRPAR